MNVERETFLGAFLSIQAGLSRQEIIEQSDCFVFRDGRIWTYNDEIACSVATDLPFTGAVKSGSLLSLLQKMPDDALDVSVEDGELRLVGKRKKAGLRMEAEVLLPVDSVEEPGKWSGLPEAFCAAIDVVAKCASKNEMNFDLCCIHFTPDFVEACNNFQLARYSLKLPIKEDFLARRDPMKAVAGLGVTKISQTAHWVHFTNPSGVVISCRQYVEAYPALGKLLKDDGEPITLPKGLREAAELGGVFSSEKEDNEIIVNISPGKVLITGQGDSGWYRESRKIKYDGPSFKFAVAPDLLKDIVAEYSQCKISANVLRADAGAWVFASALGTVDE